MSSTPSFQLPHNLPQGVVEATPINENFEALAEYIENEVVPAIGLPPNPEFESVETKTLQVTQGAVADAVLTSNATGNIMHTSKATISDVTTRVSGKWVASETLHDYLASNKKVATTPEDFGARKNDHTFDNTPAFTQALQYLSSDGGVLTLSAGRYYFVDSPGWDVPPNVTVQGQGTAEWRFGTNVAKSGGTELVFTGTTQKRYTVDRIEDMINEGGVIVNPQYGNPSPYNLQLSPTYSLWNGTNSDASGATPATLKVFSAGIRLTPGSGGGLRDLRVLCGRKVDGATPTACYENPLHTALADDTGVGVWLDNRNLSALYNVQIVGYWRERGVLSTHISKTANDAPSSEFNYFENVQVQNGFDIRSEGNYTIQELTADSISIKHANSHRFLSSGKIRAGSYVASYTSVTFIGGATPLLRLNGLTVNPILAGLVVGSKITNKQNANTGNFGSSGSILFSCNFGTAHNSRVLLTSPSLSPRFTTCPADFAISGASCRAVHLDQCTFVDGGEVGVFAHDCLDMHWTKCYGEGQEMRVAVGGAFGVPQGKRMIATPNARDIRDLGSTWNDSLDWRPAYPGHSDTPRFYNQTPNADNGFYTLTRALPQNLRTDGNYLTWELLVNQILEIGAAQAPLVLKSYFGALDLRSNLVTDAVRIRNGNASCALFTETSLRSYRDIIPNQDTVQNLGLASNRFGTVYATTGTINTSDAREKTNILPISDEVLDAWGRVSYKTFQWMSSVEAKGELARVHFGLIAQEVFEVFLDCDLDPFSYGLLCHDAWEADEENGLEAGERFGLRYDQCAILESAYLRRELARLKETHTYE